MEKHEVDNLIDTGAEMLKRLVHKASERAADTVHVAKETCSDVFHEARHSSAAPNWVSLIGQTFKTAATGDEEPVVYRVLSYAGNQGGVDLMVIRYANGATGQYPLTHILQDHPVSAPGQPQSITPS